MKRSVVMAVAIGVSAALIAGCGSDDEPAASVSAPGSGSGPATVVAESIPAASDSAFPITITNALGSVEVPQAPENIVAVGDAELDALLSLGVVPTTYVGYSDELLPYQTAALGGASPPEMLSLVDGMPFEQIAAAEPDLIVSLSWTDEESYPLLNDIAPVVSYVDDPWGDAWQTQVAQIAAGLGRSADGATLVADIEAQVAEAAAAHPQLAGSSVTFTSADAGAACSVDLPTSPVLVFLGQLGLEPALEDPASAYCVELSPESLPSLDADVMLLFGARDELESNPVFQQIPGVEAGNVVWLDDTMANAVNSPTPLAIPAFLETVVPQIAAVAG